MTRVVVDNRFGWNFKADTRHLRARYNASIVFPLICLCGNYNVQPKGARMGDCVPCGRTLSYRRLPSGGYVRRVLRAV